MTRMTPRQSARLDDAARAGWLYYIAGNTQDQIAAKLGVSRQSAQRLVALAMSEGLVKVRIEHPIARCMDLAEALTHRFGLKFCEVAPGDPDSASTTIGVAETTAMAMERALSAEEPIIMGVGTGRTLRAAVELLPEIDCPQHRVVSLTGNIAPDGSAAYFNVVFTMADTVKAPSFPMPLPVVASSATERDMLHQQKTVRATLEMAAKATLTFVGVGEFDENAPLHQDGFIDAEEMARMRARGAVGEILGWAFDEGGRLIEGGANDRVASAPIPSREAGLVVACAMGPRKLPGVSAAIRGGLVNGLITNETTAEALLGL
ncbi:sugar-binding transcriptional regulator [Rhodovulum sp. DZ06]|uniref:sugar-binding transcriptional regulator n=1 Tax=Rhodovulum sp. DZ06 TaxID=3425126 RepID=UPI003D3343D8